MCIYYYKALSLLTGHLLAAYHTSAIALTWTIYLLTQNLDVQYKLQKEIGFSVFVLYV